MARLIAYMCRMFTKYCFTVLCVSMCYDRIENLAFIVVSLSMIIYGTIWFLVEEGEGVSGGHDRLAPHGSYNTYEHHTCFMSACIHALS